MGYIVSFAWGCGVMWLLMIAYHWLNKDIEVINLRFQVASLSSRVVTCKAILASVLNMVYALNREYGIDIDAHEETLNDAMNLLTDKE